MSIREAIRCLTLGEMLQGAAEFSAVLIFLVATITWVITWLKPHPDIHVGVAMYTSERGFTLEGTTKTTLTRTQDLVSNCTLWRFPPTQQNTPVKVTDLHSWVLSKLLLENLSDQALTNLRLGVVTRLHNTSTELSATPNVEATGMVESTSQDGLHKYVISIASLAPHSSAILNLQTPMNDNFLRVLSQEHITVRLPALFLSADQLWNFHPTVTPFNASAMLKLESEMRTGERGASLIEKIENTTLAPSDPDLLAEDLSPRLLPTIPDCPEKTEGHLVEFVGMNE
ncbi:MAG TPA: hypothetical protein VJU54_11475 [Nitrospiraceae bacterium]|nr:hypothetical protein [Nitrospiraceae bacterium]